MFILDTELKDIPDVTPKAENLPSGKLLELYNDLLAPVIQSKDSFEWQCMPTFSDEQYKDCDQCNDDGLVIVPCLECNNDNGGFLKINSGYNDYKVQCKTCIASVGKPDELKLCHCCMGTKKALQHDQEKLKALSDTKNELLYDIRYVRSLSTLSDCQFAIVNDSKYIVIKFTGGVGVFISRS
jgi:hypothetical protein